MSAQHARWGNWAVGLRASRTLAGWDVTVWRWPPGTSLKQRELLARGFSFSKFGAVGWACDIMRADGAKVLILGERILTLEELLDFKPAPELAA